MQVQQADEGAFMQNYQTTLGQSPKLQQRSRTSSLTLQKELSTASSRSDRQGSQLATAVEQGSFEPTEVVSKTPLLSQEGSSAFDGDSDLIAAVQSPLPPQEGEQAPATAPARLKHRKSSMQTSKPAASSIARGASVADRLKNLRGFMDTDVEPEQATRQDDILEDLPEGDVPLEHGNVDEPILEEQQLLT